MRCRGFTLIELLVTIAVLAILLAIGLPSFQGSLRSNRMATATNELLASIALARTEAVRSTMGAGICASENGTACGGTWNDGWIIWQDGPGGTAGAFDAASDVVVRHVSGRSRLTVTATLETGDTVAAIGFSNRGRPVADISGLPITWILVPADACPSGQELVRAVSVNLVGQVKNERKSCS